MNWTIEPSRLEGVVSVPGDKSIAHRALMIAAVAGGVSSVRGLPDGADVAATLDCVRTLGGEVEEDDGVVRVTGGTPSGRADLDARNSGTTMRLMSGLLAGYAVEVTFDGDASLRRRPMARVVEPLRLMGAEVASDDGRPPLRIRGGRLHPIRYRPEVASAQVKSAILLAALAAHGRTVVEEPIATRDHTERMLAEAGVPVERVGDLVAIEGPARPNPLDLSIPGDISSAAFLWAGAVLTGGRVIVKDVGVNPTRIGVLGVLERSGVQVEISDPRWVGGEPVADVAVSGSPQHPIEIVPDEVPLMIDEIPLLALLATAAPGRSEIRGAAELRVKESDRISAVTAMLVAMGARIAERPDGFVIDGSDLRGSTMQAGGDHRMAMLGAVAGLAASGRTVVQGAEAANVSFPGFGGAIERLGGHISED